MVVSVEERLDIVVCAWDTIQSNRSSRFIKISCSSYSHILIVIDKRSIEERFFALENLFLFSLMTLRRVSCFC